MAFLAVAVAGSLIVLEIVSSSGPLWVTDSPHEELVGITDGGDLFNPDPQENDQVRQKINRLQRKIQEENKRVAQNADMPHYVKVVLLMPLTVSKGRASAIPLEHILHALEGTYTALIRANTSTIFGDSKRVQLQLLLANQGSRQLADDDFVDKVMEASEPEHPVVAVVGLGSSVPNTGTMAEKLAERGIPMVSAITSADTLTGRSNLWSVSPSNIQYAKALRHFLDARKDLRSGIIVRDRNKDPYTSTLGEAFKNELAPYLEFSDLWYSGGTVDQPAQPNLYAQVVTNICNAANARDKPLDTVFYAGRVADFRFFAEALKDRECKKVPLTVLASATGFESARDSSSELASGNIKVFYASSSDPPGWAADPADAPPDFEAFTDAYKRLGYDPQGLADGLAIAHHDAFASAAMAIRLSAMGVPQDQPIEAAGVAGEFPNLVLAYPVRGASGRLVFPSDAGRRAAGRIIPLRELGTAKTTFPKGFEQYEVPARGR
ncbi:hypothetical protein [Acrocarpospora sp. B8E8]|uniref:ABC transporter substrate-binding protein n=1 Tax=Acrocarpospora sp. B8E8 TaxID=3153572 RepID=UPI00325CD24A